jgi:long-chain acyl-CoA synthetase
MHQNGTSHPAAFAPDARALDPRGPLDLHAMFEGARLLVLGGTGFLGKIFWIMLLDRFPEVGKIFLLVRSSKKQTSEERFWAEVATSEAMLPLREKYKDGFEAFLREKIVPIDGDVSRKKCGIDEAFLAREKSTIDAVINVAGVVDFNPPLDEALDTNAFGAQNLVELAKALGDAPLFHTSTCYVVGNREGMIFEEKPGEKHPFPRAGELDPALWSPAREISDCLDLIAQARHRCEDAFRQSTFLEQATKNLLKRGEPTEGAALDAELSHVKRKFVSDRLVEAGLERAEHWGWPNIYTYTKSIGEQIIAEAGIPFVISRPACCESTREFPFPGWNEGIGTSAPLIFMGMKGQHQLIGRDTILDFIPSDIVCAGMILTLAELLEGTAKPVYQYGCSDTSPITMQRLAELTGIYKRKYYLRKSKGNPLVNFVQAHVEPTTISKERYDLIGPKQMSRAAKMLSDVLKKTPGPAAKLAKPAASALETFSKTEQKIDEIQMLFAPFTYYQKGPFSCANARAAYARLSDEQKALIPWHPETVDWADYFMNQHLPAMEKRIIPWLEERWKRELRPLKAHVTLATLVDQMAERHSHSLAFQKLEDEGLSRITYLDVKARVEATARRLIDAGVKKGDRVVLAALNAPEWPLAYFGITRAGGVCVPVDRDLESVQFANIVREAEAKIALWDPYVEKKGGAGVRKEVPELRVMDLAEVTLPDGKDEPVPVAIEEDDLASLIFTSGTTGKPKGVMLSHKNFLSLIAALAPLFPLGANDRVLSVLPLHHTFEFSCGFLLPFSRGARVVYIGEITGDRVTAGLKEGRITAMVGVPAVWQLLERRIMSEVRSRGKFAETVFNVGTDMNSWMNKTLGLDFGRVLFGQVHDGLGGHIKWLISGGAALPKDTQELFTGLGLKLTEGYGLTEAAPVLTVAKPGSKAGQVGKAIPGVEIKIDSPDATGVGEVLARGPNVMAGYTDEEATKAVLSDGWLKTGDLGKLDKSGRLVIVGRSKDVVVTSTGENLYPDDLEKLIGSVKHITEYTFIGIAAAGGGERLACLAVPEADDSVDRTTRMARAERHLRESLNKLPAGKQPSVVKLYDAPLPRTATRKVKRNEARAIIERLIAATRSETAENGESANGVNGASNGAVAKSHVRHAISVVRGVAEETITGTTMLSDDLGFDSLALTELLAALETKYGTIDPEALTACRTVDDVEMLTAKDRAHESRTRSIEGRVKPKTETPVYEFPREVQDAGKKAIGKLQDFFYGQMMDSEVYGRTFIPHNRQTIVIANHASHLDMGFVRHALGKYGEDIVSLAAQDYFFERGTFKRTFFENLTNLKALDRKGGLRASERQASEVLDEGKTMLIFPEGTRSPDGDIHEFKPLLGHLALANGVDILPVYLGGTRDAMPKGARVPTGRRIFARIGPPMNIQDLRRLTKGLTPADASREVAKLARRAVVALRDGDVLDIAKLEAIGPQSVPPPAVKKREHPLVELFQELEGKFDKARVEKPVSFYFTLGSDTYAKWTVLCDREKCEIRQGKPEGGTADCVLKTSAEIFTRIVRDSYVPGPAEFISGAVKSNDIELLLTFQKIFALSSAS